MTDEFSALYRTHRPEKFSDVSSQEHITGVLEAAVKNGKVAHAYLFAGSRGTGKTTVARILAREIGTSEKDLYEMDAASNRRIEDFRELNEAVHTLPFESKYKVYIIDEVHMLTKEAFNAFLKTLEEPPAHVVFVLATTELDKLPDTIRSRCQAFTFRKPTRTILTDVLTSVGKKEKKTLEKDAAELMAILAEGSFRDALGILQKVLAVAGDEKRITRELVESVTGAPRASLVNGVLEAIAAGNRAAALEHVSGAVAENVEMLTFQKLLLDRARAVLLIRLAPDMRDELKEQFGDDDFALLTKLADDAKNNITSRVLARLLTAYADTPHAYITQLPLELALADAMPESADA